MRKTSCARERSKKPTKLSTAHKPGPTASRGGSVEIDRMLRQALFAFCLPLAALQAQPPSDWRSVFNTLPAQPQPTTNAQDIERLRGQIQQATPWFLSINPNDYEANREMVRRLVPYLAATEMTA